MTIWKFKDIEITFKNLNNNYEQLNKNEYHDISHSICINRNNSRNTFTMVKNIEDSSQIIFLKEAVDTIISLDYKNKSQFSEEIFNGNYFRKGYAYNYKLEDEYVGTHGINIERIDIEYKNENEHELNLETYFNLSITFYDDDEPHIGNSITIRHITKDDLLSFSNAVSSFLNMCH